MSPKRQTWSQFLALRELAAFLHMLEKGDREKMVVAMEHDSDSPLGADFPKQHPNAVLLEALLLIDSIHKGSGRSMAGYADALVRDFDKREVLGRAMIAGIHIPRPH